MPDSSEEKSWNVVVVPYNEEWVELYRKEASLLAELFGDLLSEIHHFGSTAIPGIYAKPVIDILPVVKDIIRVDSYNDRMKALGYVPMGEYGISGRRFFFKGGRNRTHQVHIFQTGNSEIQRHLSFRDYLRSHPEDAQRYSVLKQDLAKKFPTDIESYCNGKSEFVKSIDQKAALES